MTIADRQTGDPFFYLVRQALSALLGGVLATVLLFVPMATWERLSPALMLGAFALLVVVLIPGFGHEVQRQPALEPLFQGYTFFKFNDFWR